MWAVGSYSSGPPAGGTPQILVFKTLQMTRRPALYFGHAAAATFRASSERAKGNGDGVGAVESLGKIRVQIPRDPAED